MERTIICVDMDAFFASVEQKANPALRGKPVAVIGSGKRTIITTRSYEARKFGVKTGMSIHEGKKLCPNLVIVVGDTTKYTHTCRVLSEAYTRYTPDVEIYSIDEAFMDITTTHHLFGGPVAIGESIRKDVKRAFGINCTVGIGPNVLIAKLASDLAKPDGLMHVRPGDVEALFKDLAVEELWGIGRKTAEKLSRMGIRTCGELGRAPASLLRNRFGIVGETLKDMGMGLCTRPVCTESQEAKSIGHSTTLPRDISDREEIEACLLRLSEMVGRRARRHKLMGSKVSLVIRYPDFHTFSRQGPLHMLTNDTHEIYQGALEILRGIRLRDSVRLLGVSISSLAPDPGQIPLMPGQRRRNAILGAMDELNDRYGEFMLNWASYMAERGHPDVISPAWRPKGVKHVDIRGGRPKRSGR